MAGVAQSTMEDPAEAEGRRRMIGELVAFFGLTFAVTWTICGAYIFAPAAFTAAFGAMKTGSPIFFAAVYAPSVCGLGLTLLRAGPAGLARIGAAMVRVAGGWGWVAACLVGYPALWLVVAMVQALASGHGLASVPYADWWSVLPMVILTGFVFRDAGPLGEEFGWRAYALPRLLRLTGPRTAAVLLGAIWAVWHLPAFFLSGLSQSKFQFGAFFFEVVAFSVFMTLFFVRTRGSVLLAGIVQHMWFNAVSKAGIHPVGWITVALAAVLLLFGSRLWGGAREAARLLLLLPQTSKSERVLS